jgi:hypothetical protein
MTVNPQPRPALRKAPDRSIHPAAPRLTPIIASLPPQPDPVETAPRKNRKGKPSKGSGKSARSKSSAPGTVDEKTVELVVAIPKSLRKRVRAKAAEHGITAEQAAYQLLRSWAGE